MIFVEIMLASTMNAVFVACFALLTSTFQNRANSTQRFLLFVTNSRFCNGMRRAVYVSRASTVFCGSCWLDSGRIGALPCRSFNPPPSSAGSAEPSVGTGHGNRGVFQEDPRWVGRFAI